MAEHVRSLISGAPDDRIFRFVEAAESGRLGPALKELDQLLAAGEEPAKLAAQLYQQIELVAVLAAGPQIDPMATGRALGLSNPSRMAGISPLRTSSST
jgi:DNA polymerase III delta subunit